LPLVWWGCLSQKHMLFIPPPPPPKKLQLTLIGSLDDFTWALKVVIIEFFVTSIQLKIGSQGLFPFIMGNMDGGLRLSYG